MRILAVLLACGAVIALALVLVPDDPAAAPALAAADAAAPRASTAVPAEPTAPTAATSESPERMPARSVAERIALAGSVGEVVALLRAHGPPPSDASRAYVREVEQGQASTLAYEERALRAHRAEGSVTEAARITELELQARCMSCQRERFALRRGNYAVLEAGSELTGRIGPYELVVRRNAREGLDLIVVHHWTDSEPQRQIEREIVYRKKVAEFNSYTERMRRSVLRQRRASLATGEAGDLAWLRDYFPEGCVIDERSATIR